MQLIGMTSLLLDHPVPVWLSDLKQTRFMLFKRMPYILKGSAG